MPLINLKLITLIDDGDDNFTHGLKTVKDLDSVESLLLVRLVRRKFMRV